MRLVGTHPEGPGRSRAGAPPSPISPAFATVHRVPALIERRGAGESNAERAYRAPTSTPASNVKPIFSNASSTPGPTWSNSSATLGGKLMSFRS